MVVSPGLGLEERGQPTESILQVHSRTGSSLAMAGYVWRWMRVETWPGACWVGLTSLVASRPSAGTTETSSFPESGRTWSAGSEGFAGCYPKPDLRRRVTLHQERKST